MEVADRPVHGARFWGLSQNTAQDMNTTNDIGTISFHTRLMSGTSTRGWYCACSALTCPASVIA